jgi:hypothetical protein
MRIVEEGDDVIAVLGGNFLEPNPFTYFFGTGIGTNIGASIVWGFLAGLLGMFVARKVKAAWARLHSKIDAHHKHQDEHNAWVADHMAAIHRKVGLGEPEPHPHFDLPAGEPATELPIDETT